MPFWEAIDRLCKAGALRYDTAFRQGFGTRQGFLALMADRIGRGPVSDSGPFRVQITGIHSVFERDFTLDPDQAQRAAKPPGAGDLTVMLAVLPEPGMMLHQNGAAIVTEAIDDWGRSCWYRVPPSAGSTDLFRVMTGPSVIQVNRGPPYHAPDPPGT